MKNKLQRGFSLLGILVATSIFVSFMTVAVSTTILLFNTNLESQKKKEALLQLSSALELLSNEAQLGSSFVETRNIFSFIKDGDTNPTVYSVRNKKLYRTKGDKDSALTEDNLNIETLKFVVSGTNSGEQPYVHISAKGKILIGEENEEFAIQTRVTQRELDDI